VKVSYEEKKAWLTADESVTDTALVKAVQKAGSYEGKVIERQPFN
jgi:copper chaperone CopZ